MLKNYIATSEFNNLAGVSSSLMSQLVGVQKMLLGGVSFVKKSTIPPRYKDYVNKCTDLTYYLPTAYFCELIGRSSTYIAVLRNQGKTVEVIENIVRKKNFINVGSEFIELLNDNKVFMVIRKRGDELDFDGVIEVQGIKIGWY